MKRRNWTQAEIDYIDEHYPNVPTREIAEALGRPLKSVWHLAYQRKLKKRPEVIVQMARDAMQRADHAGKRTQFRKGQAPWNKGKPFQPGGRAVETQFKAGHRTHSWMPIGSERVADGYLQRKVTDTGYPPRDWVPVHRLLWLEAGREIPPGHALRFKNGDKRDIRLDNLELVSRGELMKRNSHHNYGPEVARLVQLRGALSRQINCKTKGQS